MIRDVLKKCVHDALLRLSLVGAEIHFEHPADPSHGDYSTNVAMALSSAGGGPASGGRETKRNPRELASDLVEKMRENLPAEIERVEIAGPGFINFFLSREFLSETIESIVKAGDAWGRNDSLVGKKVMVEYTDPNPFKEFHVGHLMSNAIGESISRIIEFSGAEVKRVNYQGDVGLHVAKAIWGLRKSGVTPQGLAGETGIEVLGRAYARGARAYEEDEEAKMEIISINKAIYSRESGEINELYDKGRALSLSYFETIYQRIGTKFDHYFFESQSGVFGLETVKEHGDVFEESDGAIVFRGDRYGLHTRVFVNSKGLPTYEAKDLGLAKLKYDTYPYDLSIVVTGNEIVEYYKVVLKAMESIFPNLAQKAKHVPHGMMRLPSGKMSSRTGDVVTAMSLIEDVTDAALSRMKDSDVPDGARAGIAGEVAVGAIKYSILKQAAHRDIVFDMGKALSLEGDSGPYIMYALTRARSILDKARSVNAGVRPRADAEGGAETILERMLCRFPEVVLRAQEEMEPHHVTTYLTEIAGLWNAYYAKEKVLDGSPDEPYKLMLTEAVATTLENGLHLLAIPAPERM